MDLTETTEVHFPPVLNKPVNFRLWTTYEDNRVRASVLFNRDEDDIEMPKIIEILHTDRGENWEEWRTSGQLSLRRLLIPC